MRKMNCLNLTDILQNLYATASDTILDFKTIIKNCNELADFEKCERIYIGSYFCGQYFLNLPNKIIENVRTFCEAENVKITLVIPTFSEKNLDRGKDKIDDMVSYLKEVLDEVTINDYGMLEYMAKQYKLKCNMGRLFMKDYRDLRYPEYFNTTLHPKIFTSYFNELIKEYDINSIEIDPTHKTINLETCPQKETASLETCPQGLVVGVHGPYCYMTVGQICEFGSIHKEIDKKFRPNGVCQGECNSHVIRYKFNDGHEWLRVGRAVYFENSQCEIEGISSIRNIYFPVDLVVKR